VASPLIERLFQRIAAKIFGLALFLLALTIVLAVFLLREVNRLEGELAVISGSDLPLAAAVDDINETGLRRRLAFARWFGALNREPPNAEIVAEASRNFENFVPRQQEAIRRAKDALAGYPEDSGRGHALAEIRALLNQVESSVVPIIARQRELIALQERGQHDEANRLVNVLNDQIRVVQEARSTLAAKVRGLTEAASHDARRRHERVQFLTVVAALLLFMLGLLTAAMVTRRLTRPIRTLTQAVGDVRAGRLDVQIGAESRDEIGTLTESFNYFVGELRAKEEMKQTFGKYVDPRVLERLLAAPGAGDGGGERRTMTVSFGDLVGFSGLAEQLSPALMVVLLNRHFGLQAQCVQGELGIVDKYIGDAIMSFWGPPFVDPGEQAVRACRAALAQVASLAVLQSELPELTGLRRSDVVLDARIGIATGEVVVGSIGSDSSRSYTVIGDTVNVASRIEGANRTYGTRIIIDEQTAVAVRQTMETRELDTIVVKGRSQPVRIFELLCEAGALSEPMCALRERYAAGLADYRAGRWDAAGAAFRDVLDGRPGDGPAHLLLDRCQRFAARAPDPDWAGVWRITEK
jgi:adenylate cyclase